MAVRSNVNIVWRDGEINSVYKISVNTELEDNPEITVNYKQLEVKII